MLGEAQLFGYGYQSLEIWLKSLKLLLMRTPSTILPQRPVIHDPSQLSTY